MSRSIRFSDSELLRLSLPAWRSRLMLLILFAGFTGLAVRALYLQVLSTDFLQGQGRIRMERTLTLPASRGRIMDRNGVVVASSLPARAVWFDSREFNPTAEQVKLLAGLLSMDAVALQEKIRKETKTFVYIKRQVPVDVTEQVVALRLPGLGTLPEYRRQYPEGSGIAHVVGFTNVEDIGQEGIELAYQQQLSGTAGERNVVRDRLGRIVEDLREVRPPINGHDLNLSIDLKIQYLANLHLRNAIEQHRAKAGGVVVLDAKTGEVLALSNFPTYDPNDRGRLTGAQLRNRVLTDTFEPGSTMKPFTVALALETGLVKPSTVIQTAPGRLTIGSATISDAHPHGALTVEEVIQKSSNVGTTKIALRLEPQEMWSMFTEVGLGQAPNLGFPGAVAGRVRPWKTWKPIEQATMSYGHGLSVSLIQLARAYTVFTNDGQVLPASFMKLDRPPKGTQVFSSETSAIMRKMLEMAAAPGGTAPKAQVVGYRVAGKTGTAHKQEGGRYVNKYVSSFVGFAPVSNPRLLVAVMLDEPGAGSHYGGDVAAPIFSNIVLASLRHLQVKPDAPFKQIVMVPPVVEDSL
ncbi:MAG: penicillin-binding protein 2 [Burkholderiales bacterium]|nr:penicillin-binding protein 2 [Burkholderiales bacterium]